MLDFLLHLGFELTTLVNVYDIYLYIVGKYYFFLYILKTPIYISNKYNSSTGLTEHSLLKTFGLLCSRPSSYENQRSYYIRSIVLTFFENSISQFD